MNKELVEAPRPLPEPSMDNKKPPEFSGGFFIFGSCDEKIVSGQIHEKRFCLYFPLE